MLIMDWQYKVKHEKSTIVEMDVAVTPNTYAKFKKHMEEQGKNTDVHIVGMNYTPSTGRLKIKFQLFNGAEPII